MNFDIHIKLILEGVKDRLIPLTDAEIKSGSDMFTCVGKLINRYTAKYEHFAPRDRYMSAYGHPSPRSDRPDMERIHVMYLSHLKNGLYRVITKDRGDYGTKFFDVSFYKDIDHNPDPMHSSLHRLDGPAVITGTGGKSYFIDGEEIEEDKYWENPRVKAYKAGGQPAVDILDL